MRAFEGLKKERVFMKPYLREDMGAVVPNSLDEDLQMGPEQFLAPLKSDREWATGNGLQTL